MRPRTIIDTNLFVSGTLFKRGNPFALLKAWEARGFQLLLADDQYAELRDVFSRPSLVGRYGLSDEDVRGLFRRLDTAERVRLSASVPFRMRDPKDEPILAAALGGDADYLVSGDGDILIHHDYPRLGMLSIVNVVEFLRILDESERPGSTP